LVVAYFFWATLYVYQCGQVVHINCIAYLSHESVFRFYSSYKLG